MSGSTEAGGQCRTLARRRLAILGSVRIGHWWYSKIPPLLALAYALMLRFEPPPGEALLVLGGLLVAIVFLAAYGYVINNIFDIEEDRLAGKPNEMGRFSRLQQAAIAAALVLAGFVPLAVLELPPVCWLLLAISYLFPSAYSMPPIRWKERGILGVVADAVGAQTVPTLFVAGALAPSARPVGELFVALVGAALVWTTAAGLRGILVHQCADRSRDLEARVETFAAGREIDSIRSLVMHWIMPVEIAGLAVFVGLILPVAPVLAVALPVFLLLELTKKWCQWKLPLFRPDQPYAEPYLPLLNNELHEVWLPLALAFDVAVGGGSLLALPAVHVALFYGNIRTRVRVVNDLVGDVRRIRAERAKREIG